MTDIQELADIVNRLERLGDEQEVLDSITALTLLRESKKEAKEGTNPSEVNIHEKIVRLLITDGWEECDDKFPDPTIAYYKQRDGENTYLYLNYRDEKGMEEYDRNIVIPMVNNALSPVGREMMGMIPKEVEEEINLRVQAWRMSLIAKYRLDRKAKEKDMEDAEKYGMRNMDTIDYPEPTEKECMKIWKGLDDAMDTLETMNGYPEQKRMIDLLDTVYNDLPWRPEKKRETGGKK